MSKLEKKDTKKPVKSSKKNDGFSAAEKAAMKERAKELKAAASREEDENAVLEKIAEMEGSDRKMAERIHAIVKATAPNLFPKTWYGMPAYAKDGKIVCFFQSAQKFGARYATFGFNDSANLDDGDFWAVAYALQEMTDEVAQKIEALVKKAAAD